MRYVESFQSTPKPSSALSFQLVQGTSLFTISPSNLSIAKACSDTLFSDFNDYTVPWHQTGFNARHAVLMDYIMQTNTHPVRCLSVAKGQV